MNDPWDVKSVRQGNHYQSCMRINGIPLLPPVLSKECRKEMQYYKLLAKEVEKRISVLKPYIENYTDDDKTDAPELPECEQVDYEPSPEKSQTKFEIVMDQSNLEKPSLCSQIDSTYNSQHSQLQDQQIVIDFNLQLENKELIFDTTKTLHSTLDDTEVPERDCDYIKPMKEKELLTEVETSRKQVQECIDDIVHFDFDLPADSTYIQLHNEGPSSLSSKSFTGSLHDLHSESVKEAPSLIRQRSYTVLQPSPQLLAHLEVQSVNAGVDVHSISMSESMSNISLPRGKRRSWDLESAKVKWSSMAQELKNTALTKPVNNNTNHKNANHKKPQNSVSLRSHSQVRDRCKKNAPKVLSNPKSDPVHRPKARSPVRNIQSQRAAGKEPITPQNRSVVKNAPAKSVKPKNEEQPSKDPPPALISASDDPATRVRELYEKLQKQQMMQMANLIEKQKREQQLLQTVFEEQNTVLLKQLKTVCPKIGPLEIKQAWGDLKDDTARGPVSLSQLINNSSVAQSVPNSPISKTLTESNNYINKCDNALKKSREITSTIKKQQPKRVSNGRAPISYEPQSPSDGNITRTHSPVTRNTSRKLSYDTSPTSDAESLQQELEPLLTDRTNDTMADLNVTFPSDNSEEYKNIIETSVKNVKCISPMGIGRNPNNVNLGRLSTDYAVKSLENSIQNSMNMVSNRSSGKQAPSRTATAQERVAATKIVAWAKGYLVRRLMRTERVEATVQTIRDALLCALQLHQDREGIRGADVDLHRRLIQQITAACYSLHDTFVASSPAERCALIAADRERKKALANRQVTPRSARRTDIMSKSFSGALPARSRSSANIMTQSNYETCSAEKGRPRYMPSPRRRPWR